MHKQREWRNELEKMKIGNVVGCLSVESKTLRANLVPITTRTLDQVHRALMYCWTVVASTAEHSLCMKLFQVDAVRFWLSN